MIGQRINNYEIVQQIGEGGMGAVYMARHPFIDRKVAVKVLRASLANDPAVVHRFFNEAKAANAIRHPNIIDILDVGLLPDGRTPYLIMELLEGENVSQRLKRGLMSAEDAISIATQTAAAVTAAHAQGIIHRDLKPENLFLARDPRTGKELVKVLDFGIAKLRGTVAGSGDGVKTQTGALMGTPPYMSPEQCRGISGDVDQRTDVYAMGIILYEMLCGTPPFVGEGFGDVLVQHLTRPPDPPRARNPNIPAALERVILCALSKSLTERYQTMADLQAALEGREAPAEPFVPTTSEKMAIGATTMLPFQRQTTTLSANAGEVESEPQLPPSSRRGVLLAGAGAAVAAVALVFALRSPAPVKHAGGGDPVPPPVVTHPPPDAGAAVVAPKPPEPHAPTIAEPTKKPAPAVHKPPARSKAPPAANGESGMGKW